MSRQSQRGIDVCCLRGFIAASQENHNLSTVFGEIDAISRPTIDTHFGDSFANSLHVAGISCRKPFDSCQDARPTFEIAKFVDPNCEDIGFANLEHKQDVADGLQPSMRIAIRKQAHATARKKFRSYRSYAPSSMVLSPLVAGLLVLS